MYKIGIFNFYLTLKYVFYSFYPWIKSKAKKFFKMLFGHRRSGSIFTEALSLYVQESTLLSYNETGQNYYFLLMTLFLRGSSLLTFHHDSSSAVEFDLIQTYGSFISLVKIEQSTLTNKH